MPPEEASCRYTQPLKAGTPGPLRGLFVVHAEGEPWKGGWDAMSLSSKYGRDGHMWGVRGAT